MKKQFLAVWRAHGPALGLAALALVACGGADGGATAGPAIGERAPTVLAPPQDYSLVWSDEFASDGLPDVSKWEYDTGLNKAGWHNHELQYYSRAQKRNAEVLNGRLTITARKESLSAQADWGGQRYSSARLITAGKKDWTYGFFEVRAKLPCGRGTWPAIWMLASQGTWPAAGELDIMEQIGNDPTRVFSTVHTAAGSGGNGVGAAVQVADACTAFHTYQMHWTAQQVSFGIDGKTHFTYANPGTGAAKWPFDKPQFLILNIAIGGDLGGTVDDSIFPVQLDVDYVRVYQKTK